MATDKDIDWNDTKVKLDITKRAYDNIPLSSSWFVMSQLERLYKRFNSGERSLELYREIIEMYEGM